ncbi:Cullin [Gloeophyllum trabeum ATCC 11539]|uniref:Anaphase-promoting complex subunit 2 n=1 Tax=Gloeophyllum trabeum (strain ATCC 11539 / FP-39264 / Madison 617) TaxID=670483 RepID=S7PU43_GLOTA|nr:Cullin [Gloeophyllum trabeum ATCC 11539]EPQ50963.1 Cullin [Gloeophyllum trabeum ATCC 11539]
MASPGVQALVEAKWQSAFKTLNREEPGISGLLKTSQARQLASDFLRPRALSEPRRKYRADVMANAFRLLYQTKQLHGVLENFLEEMRQQRHLITEDVEAYMHEYEVRPYAFVLVTEVHETADSQIIAQLVHRLVEWFNAWRPTTETDGHPGPLESLGHVAIDSYTDAFQTHIYSVLPPSFSSGFKDLIASTLPVSDPAPPPDRALWDAFHALGLIERYESLISSVCYELVEKHVVETCAGQWSERMLQDLRDWMQNKVLPWMCLPYAPGARTMEEAGASLHGVGPRFDFHVCKTLCDLRTSEIFDIIVDYPDSIDALYDLKECLYRVDQRSNLVQSLRKANKKRLLHPGADTKDILAQYVSTIRSLRIVDPPGVLLYKVADPIRRYLRDRADTIRCIVSSLVGDNENGESLIDDEPPLPYLTKDAEDYSDPHWEPEPIDAGPDFRANKPGDVISTLVSIYDTKDVFVKELQVLLAQRLLAVTDGNYEKERRNIEILKVRFGEQALQVCEVMLRDMTDSRRIDQHVQSQKPSILHPVIISRHFWPSLQSGSFVMPQKLRSIQEEYAREFTAFKPDKRLVWLSHMGSVKLELELQDRTIEAEVTPVAAAIIELFSEKDVWTAGELMAQMQRLDKEHLRKGLNVWVDLGVLKEEGADKYRLLEVAEESSKKEGTVSAPKPKELPAVQTTQQQQAEQMRVFWNYIEGMLTNLGSLPLDRIQNMLKFARGYDRSIEQLGMFMEAARREGLVVVRDGMWRLNK